MTVMAENITIGLELAKNAFQAHGADASGAAVLRKKLRRDQVLAFSVICRPVWWRWKPAVAPTSAARDREAGHETRLIPPA